MAYLQSMATSSGVGCDLIDKRVELASMTVDGDKRTRITAAVTAETEDEAREIGLADIGEFARVMRLPAEPVKVIVTA
jgi:hypothetical protein